MGRTSDLERKVKILEVSLEKLQMEAQNSVSALVSKVKALEDIIRGNECLQKSSECSNEYPKKT